MTRVARTEITHLDGVERLPNGGVRVPASLTRTGVLEYESADGTKTREWRPPGEVFAPDSLATLRAATVTDLHPDRAVHAGGVVTAQNWSDLAVGHVADDVRQVGDFVAATLVVQKAAEVALIDQGARKDLSCGYTCEVEPTAGVTPEGERYDGIQRSIRYNHVALGPADWGRAGPECALRLDGGGLHVHAPATAAHTRRDAAAEKTPMKIKIGGREYVLRADAMEQDVPAAQAGADAQQAKQDADAAALDALQKALQDAMGALASMRAKSEAVAPEGPTADPAVLDALVIKRERLRADARTVLGAEATLDGKPDAEIKRLVIAKVLPTVKLDALDARVIDGMFVALTATQRNDALGDAHADALAATGGARDESSDAARARAAKANSERGRKPLVDPKGT